MALDSELQKKLQIFLAFAILVVGVRAAYIVYERHEANKETKPAVQPSTLKADSYVTPKKLHAYDLESTRELTKQSVWVKYGYLMTYYPYDPQRHKTDFAHEAGMLGPLQQLSIQDVFAEAAPQAAGVKQVMACFAFDGKNFAVPIGAEKGSDFKLRSPDMFFLEDPHDLYKHWPADVWKKIDAHEVDSGMSELQASFAIGMGIPEGSGPYGSRTLHYANAGKPFVITFDNDKAVVIKPGE